MLAHGLQLFKPVKGYEGLYEVSTYGNVKSLPKEKLTQWGLRVTRERILKVDTYHPKGYRFVTLIKNGIRKSHSVHRLVATAFIPNPENYPQLNHKDTIKDNNVVDNLEWCNNSHNQLHAFKYGLNKPNKGEAHGMSKVTEEDVFKIREFHQRYQISNRNLGLIFNITKHHVQQIVSRTTWKHI
tara:strand:+ start:240 stop:791 length:552 start_codon:yes stop_codon:yes gene_type:complete